MHRKEKLRERPFAHVFGCSHSAYFHSADLVLKRLRSVMDVPRVAGEAIQAASVMGFRPQASTLDTKAIVSRAAAEADRLVLAFGQVDLELGYYYRRVIKREEIDPVRFIEDLVGHYAGFIETLPVSRERIAVKGVNLTVLEDREFTFKYTRRIIFDEKSGSAPKTKRARHAMRVALKQALLPTDVQNAMHLAYNSLLADWAAGAGVRYFDINHAIARRDAGGLRNPELGLDPDFAPAGFDHHIADTIGIRALHLRAMQAAFSEAAMPVAIAAE